MPSLTAQALVVSWLFTCLAFIAVALRLVARTKLSKAAGLDDVLISWSLLFLLVTSAMYTWTLANGGAQPYAQLTTDQQWASARSLQICEAVASSAPAWPKTSVVALIARIFNPRRIIVILLYVFVAIGIVLAILIGPLNIAECSPGPGVDGAIEILCAGNLSASIYGFVVSFYLALIDLTLAVYPSVLIWRLHMTFRRKLSLAALMSISMIATVFAIAKAVQITQLGDHTGHRNIMLIFLWTDVEAALLIVTACIPTMAPIWRAVKASYSDLHTRISSKLSLSKASAATRSADDSVRLRDFSAGSHAAASPVAAQPPNLDGILTRNLHNSAESLELVSGRWERGP